MIKTHKNILKLLTLLGLTAIPFLVFAGEEISRSNDTVRVTYQYRMPNASNWTKSNSVLRNVTTESMIENQVQSRHGNAEVRILSAQTGNTVVSEILRTFVSD